MHFSEFGHPPGDPGAIFFRERNEIVDYLSSMKSINCLSCVSLVPKIPVPDPSQSQYPANHFKVNRKYILSYASIGEMVAYSNSRVKVALLQGKEEVIVARQRWGI